MIHLSAAALRPLLTQTLLDSGTHRAATECVVASLVDTSLRGTDSHGIHLFPHYVKSARGGQVAADASPHVERSKPGTLVVDGQDGFGAYVGRVAVDQATEAAAETGVATALVKRSSHFGAAAYFALPAAERDHVAFAFTNADALVRAAHSRVAALGTNPICCAAPMEGEAPMCLDMATSTASWNKMLVHKARHPNLPPGWVADANGQPTTDPEAAQTLEPLGGYKGYGLALMVEMLTAVLAGGPLGIDQPGLYTAPIDQPRDVSHFFMVIRLDAFIAPDAFRQRLTALATRLRGLPQATHWSQDGMVPGDPEKRARRDRETSGIPITETRFAELLDVCPDARDAVISSEGAT